MKVYVLHYQRWEDTYVVGVFTKRELAEKYLDELEENARNGFNRLNYDILEEDLIGVYKFPLDKKNHNAILIALLSYYAWRPGLLPLYG